MKSKSADALEKLFEAIYERHELKDENIVDCYDRLDGICKETFKEKCIYHSECYKKTTNVTTIRRLSIKITNDEVKTDENMEIEYEDEEKPTFSTRSKIQSYNKDLCIICQKGGGGRLRKVEFLQTGKNMHEVAKTLENKEFFLRLNTIPNAEDAVANDVLYHLQCWVEAQRDAKSFPECEIQELEDVDRVVADIEIVHIVKELVFECNQVTNMSSVNEIYNHLLGNEVEENHKRYLKSLLTDSVHGLVFSKPPSRRKSENISSESFTNHLLEDVSNKADSFSTVYEAAKVIRKELLQNRGWKFSGDFSGFQVPKTFAKFLEWVLVGPVDVDSERKKSIDNSVNNIAQITMRAVKSKRQVSYSTGDGNFRDMIETPFTVGLGLMVHKESRNKKVIQHLFNLGLSVSYDRIMKIENGIGNAIAEKMSTNGGIYIPEHLVRDVPLHFAIDNIDFKNDTADGKGEFHGTTHVVFQKKQNTQNTQATMAITPSRRSYKFQHPKNGQSVCQKPRQPNDSFCEYEEPSSLIDLSSFRNSDRLWGLLQVVDSLELTPLPTWGAFNSLLTGTPQISHYETLPLDASSPTDWTGLYTALKKVQGINTSITADKKTIVTLDLQLYVKCMELRSKDEIKDNFIFRLGELHVVFAYLKVLGKYINGSGLDQILIESDVYGPTTLGQIINGKHMKRGMEAHMILYLSLLKVYLTTFETEIASHGDLQPRRGKITASLPEQEITKEIFNEALLHFAENKLFQQIESHGESFKNQALFLRKYMDMFEILLLFQRASREENWELHLASLDAMVPYFFSHDQINYARMTPLYLATMMDLKTADPETWDYLKHNFSINKTGIPFCSIGTDHALEQENKKLKVNGGVVGLTQNPNALYRFCLVSPSLNLLVNRFLERSGIRENRIQLKHYQLSGTASKRIMSNVKRTTQMMSNFDVSFEENDCVFNILTKAVLQKEVSDQLLRNDEIGKKMYQTFIDERIKGPLPIWTTMKKRKLETFQNQAKVIKCKVGQKIVQMKEERTLITRFLIMSRHREEINLQSIIGNYELSVVPQALFAAGGVPHPCLDKAKVLIFSFV